MLVGGVGDSFFDGNDSKGASNDPAGGNKESTTSLGLLGLKGQKKTKFQLTNHLFGQCYTTIFLHNFFGNKVKMGCTLGHSLLHQFFSRIDFPK